MLFTAGKYRKKQKKINYSKGHDRLRVLFQKKTFLGYEIGIKVAFPKNFRLVSLNVTEIQDLLPPDAPQKWQKIGVWLKLMPLK